MKSKPNLPNLTEMLVGIAVEQWLRYALFAGIAWLLAYVFFKKRWWRRKIIQRDPTSADVWRELRWSLLTVVIYSLVGTTTILVSKTTGQKFYWKIGSHSWLWFFSSIVIAIFIHDAYFIGPIGSCIIGGYSAGFIACIIKAPILAHGPHTPLHR